MHDDASPIAVAEYRALRATILQRGTARIVIVVLTALGWAVLKLVTVGSLLPFAQAGAPLTTLVPLVVLGAGFEAILSLHVGVERIGRYLQVYFESGVDTTPAWEHVAMATRPDGPPSPRLDPLFVGPILIAAAVNLVVTVPRVGLAPRPVAWIIVLTAHAAFVARVLWARRASAGQRAADLHAFEQLRGERSN